MGYDFSNESPIYLQIIEFFKEKIISGFYGCCERLPSVRDMSVDFGVNPNTIQKALGELESMGLIYTESTNGKFVTADKQLIERVANETMELKIEEFYCSMEKLGFTRKQVLKILKEKEI